MTWNYRAVRSKINFSDGSSEDCVTIHEAYYNDAGQPTSITKDPVSLVASSKEELVEDLKDILNSVEKLPVLDYSEIIKKTLGSKNISLDSGLID